ncbi:GNAT family N-acetyltransferase [Pseudothauera lacus]|uniref:N-acetyltransferase domain-containing protein n=1 Tax=Pseudothauera lacus TaxID=2136175 RepID=A0A2T4IG80_9RHOO|nr:GNAT family N-acetyltransferase [Pseudothauera lacus]PTD96778.1 hypothetical protein C8261_08175 [Pseudothauera lacus]
MGRLAGIAARILRMRSHLLYECACAGAAMPALQEGEHFHVLSAGSLPGQEALAKMLLAAAADNAAYLEDVRRGRVIALLISRDGELAHYSYLFLRNKTACLLGLGSGTALVGNAWTAPRFRGQGLQARAVQARAALAGEHGFERIAAETSPDNLASQRGMSKGGMRLLGRMDLIVVLSVLVLRLRKPAGFRLVAFCLR